MINLRNNFPTEPVIIKAEIAEPMRLDSFLVSQFDQYSRNFFQQLIRQGKIKINNNVFRKSGTEVKPNDAIEVTFPQKELALGLPLPETDMGVKLIYEHEQFLIIYKPAGISMHAGHLRDLNVTLVDWLLHQFKELTDVGFSDRPGIVHRLDKNTSGILIVPRNNIVHAYFANLFKDRKISKTYLAVVNGHPDKSGKIDLPITRDPVERHKMTHKQAYGRSSLTYYEVLKYLKDSALVQVNPVTGRTHQIRVHFAAIGHPLIGDKVYGEESVLINRQALHAYRLEFDFENVHYIFWCDMPKDMNQLVKKLSEN